MLKVKEKHLLQSSLPPSPLNLGEAGTFSSFILASGLTQSTFFFTHMIKTNGQWVLLGLPAWLN